VDREAAKFDHQMLEWRGPIRLAGWKTGKQTRGGPRAGEATKDTLSEKRCGQRCENILGGQGRCTSSLVLSGYLLKLSTGQV